LRAECRALREGDPPVAATKERKMAEGDVRIVVRPNGPYRVYGPFKLVDNDGNEFTVPEGEWVTLCRCGKSENKPFCDSRHKQEEWRPETRAPLS
jgi:CDGSH-type Zn-finger protein